MAAPHAGARTGRVDEDPVGARWRGSFVRRRVDFDAAGARPLGTAGNRRHAVGNRIARNDAAPVVLGRGNGERFAAAAGTVVDHRMAGRGAAKEGDQLRTFVLDLDEAGIIGRCALQIRPAIDTEPNRRKRGWLRLYAVSLEGGNRTSAVRLQRVNPKIQLGDLVERIHFRAQPALPSFANFGRQPGRKFMGDGGRHLGMAHWLTSKPSREIEFIGRQLRRRICPIFEQAGNVIRCKLFRNDH